MSNDAEQWSDVGGSTLGKWNEPATIQGIYRGELKSDSKYGQPKFAVEVAGEIVEFFAPSVLARLMRSPEIQEGREIYIEYTGKNVATSSGRAAKEFIVKVRDAS